MPSSDGYSGKSEIEKGSVGPKLENIDENSESKVNVLDIPSVSGFGILREE